MSFWLGVGGVLLICVIVWWLTKEAQQECYMFTVFQGGNYSSLEN